MGLPNWLLASVPRGRLSDVGTLENQVSFFILSRYHLGVVSLSDLVLQGFFPYMRHLPRFIGEVRFFPK